MTSKQHHKSKIETKIHGAEQSYYRDNKESAFVAQQIRRYGDADNKANHNKCTNRGSVPHARNEKFHA